MMSDASKPIYKPGGARATNIFLGLGSNLGERETNLSMAIQRLSLLDLRLAQASSIYETEPVGYLDQPWFLNQVVEMEPQRTERTEPENKRPSSAFSATPAGAEALLRALLQIETDMERERSIPKGPRVVDIDLLLFGQLVLNYDNGPEVDAGKIVVPHPRMHHRRFVLEPLCEIAPELIHPALLKSCRQLLIETVDRSAVRLYR
jgi:7,8-dihydro-6-hydroxymethylpterin-pyrophosphokinase